MEEESKSDRSPIKLQQAFDDEPIRLTPLELLINNCHSSLGSPNYIDNLSVFF